MPFANPLAIGITGGIGSGKTEVARIFQSFGATVLFADQLARELTDTHAEIRNRIRSQFGDQLFDAKGRLKRKEMAEIVFADPERKKKLESIIHPYVLDEIARRIHQHKSKKKSGLIFVEAALHYESGAHEQFDYMIVVDSDEEIRIGRVMERDQTTRQEVLQRIGSQMSAEEKLKRADFVIRNPGDKKALEKTCRFFYHLLESIASAQVPH